MKILIVFPLILISLVNTRNSRATIKPFESIMISPLYASGESKIVVKTRRSDLSFIVMLKNDKYSSAKLVQDTVSYAGTHTYTYDNRYTRTKNQIYVMYKTTDEYVTSSLIDMNVPSPRLKYINNNLSIESGTYVAILDNELNWEKKNLTYSFSNSDELYIPDYYHKIDLSDFTMTLESVYHPFFNCKASLVLKNVDHIFDDVNGANETVTFNLKLVESGTKYKLALADDVFVDPITLKMSSIKKDGYIKTKHVYLPTNEMRNQSKYNCYFVFKEFGIDKDSLFHTFEFRALINSVGDCHNSKYCVLLNK